ncbi:MAG: hypothetical protein L0154_29335 [Chloroflexi bacterium]|nr:hypothetical protein [Chloroflexota bacterium]
MDKVHIERLLSGGVCLVADKGEVRLVIKQLQDGTYMVVTIDFAHKRSHTQTSDTVATTLALMETFAAWDAWHETEEM